MTPRPDGRKMCQPGWRAWVACRWLSALSEGLGGSTLRLMCLRLCLQGRVFEPCVAGLVFMEMECRL